MEVCYQIPSIDLIFGPMYSGKTTELLRRLSIFDKLGYKCVYVNPNLDTRSDLSFSTHNDLITKLSDNIIGLKLDKKIEIEKLLNFDIIGIDEAQFFTNLKESVIKLAEEYNKKVIVGGLNGDYKRNHFGEIIDLIPYCDQVIKLNPFCTLCNKEEKKMVPALFTKRIINNESIILVGDLESYIPVCRKCFHK